MFFSHHFARVSRGEFEDGCQCQGHESQTFMMRLAEIEGGWRGWLETLGELL